MAGTREEKGMWTPGLLVIFMVWTALATGEEIQECAPVSAHPEGKIVCKPVPRKSTQPSSEGSISGKRQMFLGRVTSLLDAQTLAVESQGDYSPA